MAHKLRINLTLSPEVKHHLESKKNFNASQFFERKYMEEFLNKKALEKRKAYLQQELQDVLERVKGIKETEIVKPSRLVERCMLCKTYFDDFPHSTRKKVVPFRNVVICRGCFRFRPEDVSMLVKEQKLKEAEQDVRQSKEKEAGQKEDSSKPEAREELSKGDSKGTKDTDSLDT